MFRIFAFFWLLFFEKKDLFSLVKNASSTKPLVHFLAPPTAPQLLAETKPVDFTWGAWSEECCSEKMEAALRGMPLGCKRLSCFVFFPDSGRESDEASMKLPTPRNLKSKNQRRTYSLVVSASSTWRVQFISCMFFQGFCVWRKKHKAKASPKDPEASPNSWARREVGVDLWGVRRGFGPSKRLELPVDSQGPDECGGVVTGLVWWKRKRLEVVEDLVGAFRYCSTSHSSWLLFVGRFVTSWGAVGGTRHLTSLVTSLDAAGRT